MFLNSQKQFFILHIQACNPVWILQIRPSKIKVPVLHSFPCGPSSTQLAFTSRPLLPPTFMATPWNCSVLKSTPPYSLLSFSLYLFFDCTEPSKAMNCFFPVPFLGSSWPHFRPNLYQHPNVLTPGFSATSDWQPASSTPRSNSSSAISAPA